MIDLIEYTREIMEKVKFTIKLPKPACRTPIPVVKRHKNDAEYTRKPKHRHQIFNYAN